jgi:hypothetical protein
MLAAGHIVYVVLVDYLRVTILGICTGVLLSMRVVDAYGGRKYLHILYAIPFAAFLLYFKPSLNRNTKKRDFVKVLTSVASGVTFIVCAYYLQQKSLEIADKSIVELEKTGTLSKVYLSYSLHTLLNEVSVPLVLSDVLTLNNVEQSRNTISYTYILDSDDPIDIDIVRASMIEDSCTKDMRDLYLKPGATFHYTYRRYDNSIIGIIDIDEQVCSSSELNKDHHSDWPIEEIG